MSDRRGRQHHQDQAAFNGAHPEDIDPSRPSPLERALTRLPQQRAPDGDHPTAREGGADKGRQHGLQQQRRGRPAGAAGARLSSGRIASPAAMPANSQTSRVKRRTFRPLICAISRLPPTACTCWPKREWWSRNWNRINTPAGRPAARAGPARCCRERRPSADR
nr:Uncharacterised protein [Klebsiella pneumoniae]